MSNRRLTRVRAVPEGEQNPYRVGAEDGTSELQRDYETVVKENREKVAQITNYASLAGGIFGLDVALRWQPGLAQACGALLTSALIIAPQIIKYKNNKRLAKLDEYKSAVSPHVDNDRGEVNQDANVKMLTVLSGLNEHDAGPTLEVEAGVFLFMAALNALSNVDPNSKDIGWLVTAIVTALLAMSATFVTRKVLRDEQKRFRGEIGGFLTNIPAPKRVDASVSGSGDYDELPATKETREKGIRK